MSHSWDPDGTERDDEAAAPAAGQPEDSEQQADPQAGPAAVQPGAYQRPSFGAEGDGGGQFPIPPQAWRTQPPSDTGSGPASAAAGGGAEPSRGVTSGAPLPPGPFFPAGQQPPAPPQPSEPAPDAGTFVNWEPPPRVDWRPEPAPGRGGRRRRGRDAAQREPFFAPEPHGYAASQAPAAQAPAAQAPAPQAPAAQAPQGWTAQPPQHAPAPQRTPRPEDLLAPNVRPVDAEPASWGWRGRVHRGSGGLLKPKASAEEVAVRSAIERIQYGFSRPMTVVVIQPKGGAGKTPTTICLASAFGAYRGGYVVGWDDNETRGTLAVRVANTGSQTSTVWDLLSDLEGFERSNARTRGSATSATTCAPSPTRTSTHWSATTTRATCRRSARTSSTGCTGCWAASTG